MAPTVTITMRKALQHLEAERQQIDRQINLIQSLLGGSGDRKRSTTLKGRAVRKHSRPRMSAAARKAVSKRMKAYWAKRKAGAGKKKAAAQT